MKTELLQSGEFVSCNLICNVVAPLRVGEFVKGLQLVGVTGYMMEWTVGVLKEFIDAA